MLITGCLEVQRMCSVRFLLEEKQNKKCLKCIQKKKKRRFLAPLVYCHDVGLKPFYIAFVVSTCWINVRAVQRLPNLL